jgi:hypothetical protein
MGLLILSVLPGLIIMAFYLLTVISTLVAWLIFAVSRRLCTKSDASSTFTVLWWVVVCISLSLCLLAFASIPNLISPPRPEVHIAGTFDPHLDLLFAPAAFLFLLPCYPFAFIASLYQPHDRPTAMKIIALVGINVVVAGSAWICLYQMNQQ